MTNEKLEQCLAQALEKTAPHDVDGVLSRCEKRKGTEIPMKTKPHSLKKWMAMAACLALLLLCGGGLFLRAGQCCGLRGLHRRQPQHRAAGQPK